MREIRNIRYIYRALAAMIAVASFMTMALGYHITKQPGGDGNINLFSITLLVIAFIAWGVGEEMLDKEEC